MSHLHLSAHGLHTTPSWCECCDACVQHLPVAEGTPPFPVVFFSHGIGGTRTTYSAICAELTSQVLLLSIQTALDGLLCTAALEIQAPLSNLLAALHHITLSKMLQCQVAQVVGQSLPQKGYTSRLLPAGLCGVHAGAC